MNVICSICNEPITDGAVAHGLDGDSHAACAKRATVHGQSIDLFEAFDQIGRLKKRLQTLERAVDDLQGQARDIPFRVG